MSVLHKEFRARQQRGEEASRGLYREELRLAVETRDSSLTQAEEAGRRIERLLPGAVEAGIPVAELAELSGLSRPTLYRMLARVRETLDLDQIADELEIELASASADLGQPAGLFQLAERKGVTQEHLLDSLRELLPTLSRRLDELGSDGSIFLIDLLPSLPHNEKIVLAPLFLQRESIDFVAASAARPVAEVIGWAVLGLLRVLPEIRDKVTAEEAARSERSDP
jgi:DNA-binding phage protein